MTIGAVEPSSHELGSLSAACDKLWDLDENRLEPGQDYMMNLQVLHRRAGNCSDLNNFQFNTTYCKFLSAHKAGKSFAHLNL